MATNYNVYEAVKILADRDDFEKVCEIHRRFPYLSDFATRAITKAPEEFMAFMEFIPEHITANKVNSNMKKKFEGATIEEAAEENVVEAVKNPAKPAKKENEDASDDVTYEKLPAKRLREIVEERGLTDACVEKFGKINRSNMLAILEAADKGELEAEILEDVDDEEEAGKYDGIAAPALFKMCKERGIKAAPKKPAKHYVELLEAADAEAESEDADDDDDWADDEPAEVESKEAASDDDDDDDDDEDWDI